MAQNLQEPNIMVSAISTKIFATPECDKQKLVEKTIRLFMDAAKSHDFWGGDVEAPSGNSAEWHLVQCFKSEAAAKSWLQSVGRERLVSELVSICPNAITINEELSHDTSQASISSAIITNVVDGEREVYFEWETKIQIAQALAPGYRGSHVQPPSASQPNQWVSLLHFDCPESWEQWFNSEQRKILLKETTEFVKSTEIRTAHAGFPGWFPLDENGQPPAAWKTAFLVLLGLFPVVMFEIKFLSPLEQTWNSSLSSFINLVLSVGATTYLTTPLFIGWFRWWLYPKETGNKAQSDAKGTVIIILLFVFEILAMWNLRN